MDNVLAAYLLGINSTNRRFIRFTESLGFEIGKSLEAGTLTKEELRDILADEALGFLNEKFSEDEIYFPREESNLFATPASDEQDEESDEEFDELIEAFKAQDDEICQTLAAALHFPRYADHFSEATEDDGYITAGVTPIELVHLAAQRIQELEKQAVAPPRTTGSLAEARQAFDQARANLHQAMQLELKNKKLGIFWVAEETEIFIARSAEAIREAGLAQEDDEIKEKILYQGKDDELLEEIFEFAETVSPNFLGQPCQIWTAYQ